jgi:hypothetical protein
MADLVALPTTWAVRLAGGKGEGTDNVAPEDSLRAAAGGPVTPEAWLHVGSTTPRSTTMIRRTGWDDGRAIIRDRSRRVFMDWPDAGLLIRMSAWEGSVCSV